MRTQSIVERGIEEFLKEYRKHSHLEKEHEDEFYWNERDCQWHLFYHLRKNFEKEYGRKGASWVHAEGQYEILKRKRWKVAGRADLNVMDPERNSRLYTEKAEWEPYDAVIEMKLIWSGYRKEKEVIEDLEKLKKMVTKINGFQNAEMGYFVLLDGLDRTKVPYYAENIKDWAKNYGVTIYHWPDISKPIKSPKKATWKKYSFSL